MNLSEKLKNMRLWLIGIGTAIIAASLIISHFLIKDLQEEEKNKMEIWAAAMKNISDAGENTTDLTLVLKVLEGNKTIPVVVLDNSGNIQNYRNIRIDPRDSIPSLHRKVSEICSAEKKIRFYLDDADISEYIDIYYDDSLLLKRLAFYPYMQLTIVAVFVFIAVYMLVTLKKSEQNKVWIGLSKETAHQLGTPISSLMAWQELLEEKYPDDEYVSEMGKDISRLRIIADRFSKIGSTPENEPCSVNGLLAETAEYISRRVGKNIEVRFAAPSQDVQAIINPTLFEWVVENLCKNSADAMKSTGGRLMLTCGRNEKKIWVEVSDTGAGIPKSKHKKIFTPGYTTKKRGWGLGLSLAKRIVEEYHKGRIFVKSSEPGKGTTIRIEITAGR
jgi:hypothetical protein